MWKSVSASFFDFSKPLEGVVHWMYTDILGKVTIGLGNLIDSEADALSLPAYGCPYHYKGNPGAAVNDNDVRADWQRVKNDPSLRGHADLCESVTNVRVDDPGTASLVAIKLEETANYLVGHGADPQSGELAFDNFSAWPADAQLGLLSMSWAMGPAFADSGRWPNFRKACKAEGWLAAAAACKMSNAWLDKRNAVNRGLYRNAAWSVEQANFDGSVLWLPIGVTRPTVSLGDSDSGGTTYVSELQSFLTWLGYSLTESGQFDATTESAVKQFQSQDGLNSDGRVGSLTWASLGYEVPQ